MSNRDSLIFYRTFYDCIKELPQEDEVKLYDAIFGYIFDGIEPKLEGLNKGIFSMIKVQLDANNKRYEDGKRGAGFGKQGGRPKKKNPEGVLDNGNSENPKGVLDNGNSENPKGVLDNGNSENPKGVIKEDSSKTPNVNVNVNENVNENVNVNVSQSVIRAHAREDGQDGLTDDEKLEEIFNNCELERYNPDVENMLRSAIERMYYSEKLTVGNANLPRAKVRSYLQLLNSGIIDSVLAKMSKNENRILNPTAYLMSLIVNEICEQESSLILSLPPGYISEEEFYVGKDTS